jgi:hypothetical protein
MIQCTSEAMKTNKGFDYRFRSGFAFCRDQPCLIGKARRLILNYSSILNGNNDELMKYQPNGKLLGTTVQCAAVLIVATMSSKKGFNALFQCKASYHMRFITCELQDANILVMVNILHFRI